MDLAYANAALQWVSDHERLFPRLLSALAPGGVLAVQMPDNLDEPSHTLMRDTAADARFAPSIGDAEKLRARILPAQRYYDLLAPLADVDVWRTTYYHRMDDAAAIVQWLRATGLKPFLDPLTPNCRRCIWPNTSGVSTSPIRRAPTASDSWASRVCSSWRGGATAEGAIGRCPRSALRFSQLLAPRTALALEHPARDTRPAGG